LTVRNEEQHPLKVQIRAMQWTQQDGKDVTGPTQNVVASPPFITLKPMEQYQVRVVRTSNAPLQAEESYRVLIDEIPEPHQAQSGTVNLVLRQSLPVFFSGIPNRVPKVSWTIQRDGSTIWLIGRNTGNRRIRLADVSLESGGASIFQAAGLVGYVLPGSEMRWAVTPATPLASDGRVRMKANGDTGPIDVALAATPAK
jgi:fimbrial chaperone protein